MKLDPDFRYNLTNNQSECVYAERVGYHGNHEGFATADDHVNSGWRIPYMAAANQCSRFSKCINLSGCRVTYGDVATMLAECESAAADIRGAAEKHATPVLWILSCVEFPTGLAYSP
jgi:hypothetical protein